MTGACRGSCVSNPGSETARAIDRYRSHTSIDRLMIHKFAVRAGPAFLDQDILATCTWPMAVIGAGPTFCDIDSRLPLGDLHPHWEIIAALV